MSCDENQETHNLEIKSGEPYSRKWAVTLPADRDWWPTEEYFEVRSEVRKSKDSASDLILDLTPFITFSFSSSDVVDVFLYMNGLQTRELTSSGHYDLVMSDPGTSDDRLYIIDSGKVKRTTFVTGSEASP